MEPSPNTPIYETALLTCWRGEDGIIYSKSKPAQRSIENYQELFKVYHELSNGGKHKLCTVGDISHTQPMSKEVREFISAELPRYIKAMALDSDTVMGKAIGTLFVQLSDSPYPSRLFHTKEDAVSWLKEYL